MSHKKQPKISKTTNPLNPPVVKLPGTGTMFGTRGGNMTSGKGGAMVPSVKPTKKKGR